MYISKQLKENNIAEYLLYMWQVEDMIRAAHLDIDRLQENYISKFQALPGQQEELTTWYSNLIRMMHDESKESRGHLQINRNVMLTLEELHHTLLSSPKFPFYTAAYYKALPYIVELRNRGENKELSEVENCFDALYGIMMLRLQKKEIGAETLKAMADITKLIGLLSDYYKQEKAGTLEA